MVQEHDEKRGQVYCTDTMYKPASFRGDKEKVLLDSPDWVAEMRNSRAEAPIRRDSSPGVMNQIPSETK